MGTTEGSGEATIARERPTGGAQRSSSAARGKNLSPTLRSCATSRQERPTNQLIRFVVGPDDVIYPDLNCKLPGRGVWVTADARHIVEAIKTRAFGRSLKRNVEIPENLAQTVERLLEKRVIAALSLANKAGKLVTGFDKVTALIERGNAVALVHASDAAPGGVEKLDRKGRKVLNYGEEGSGVLGTIFADCLSIDQMSLAIGRTNVVHAGLSEGGATQQFIAQARRLVDYRRGVGSSPRP